MNISTKGLKLIQEFEGCKLTAYTCPAGVLTIGYGHTGKDVTEGLTISQEEADALLYDDLVRFEDGVNRLVAELDISQGMYDALVSFAYNLGLNALSNSTLLKKLKQGLVFETADEFMRWNKVNGKESAGLTRRRAAERELFLTEDD